MKSLFACLGGGFVSSGVLERRAGWEVRDESGSADASHFPGSQKRDPGQPVLNQLGLCRFKPGIRARI